VNGTFGFGLGAKSYAFVDVTYFRDPHLNRRALPLQQAVQVYNTTAASATIVGNSQRVINRGIPVGRATAATGTHIRQVAITRADRPAAGAKETATTATGSTRTVAPLILHGPDRPGQGTTGSSAAVRETYPAGTLVFAGSKEANLRKTARQTSVWTTETPRFRTTATSQEVFEHPVATQKPQPVTTAEWASPVRSELPTRSEHQWQYSAPSYQAQGPAEPRWSIPAPTPAPQPVHSYSAPTVASTLRAQSAESRPSYSAPSAPAASAPASHTQSSSDKKGR
jgi:hypothetical protein